MSPKINERATNVKEPLKAKSSDSGQMSTDEIDRKILKLLVQNARLSFRELGRQLKLSTGAVIERLRKLEVKEVISGYSANINTKKLGFDITAIIELVAPKMILKRAMVELSNSHNVYAIYHTAGTIDVIIIAKFRSIEELNVFLESLYSKLEVIRTETRIVFNTIKEDFRTLIQ
ncbi:MAG: Lrp/AsnC family transcriptional regulator [Candidatus Aenigmarchaeota archaeon]|nr:Lrp/AsnC family transcriptional regulator [Candidatus Aenigmarchaeota archaeon]